jgi:Ca-activated chloride channel homolog
MLQLSKVRILLMIVCILLVAYGGALAQTATPKSAPPVPPTEKRSGEYKLSVDVGLVVLHATVLDKKGHIVDGLKVDDFKVYEDGAAQKLSVFSHADIPVTMGIVIDDSGSMREKRASVNAAALAFVKTSNPQDQVFVVNFNDVYYLDTPGDFAASVEDLKAALGKIDSRGGTALYDAVWASIDHLKLGNRDKKAILVITDGEDNASRYSFEELVRTAQKSNAVIYTIGLLGEEEPGGLFKMSRGSHRGAKILEKLAESTGGKSYFPKSLGDVGETCVQIARDIRNQYTLAYYPTNARKDGSYRTVRVDVTAPDTHTKLSVRTRPGYYAPKTSPAASVTASALQSDSRQ